MTTVAVLGATGTAGARVVAGLRERGVTVVPVSRATGVDLVTGAGLTAALSGVDVVVDVSNPYPAGDVDLVAALAGTTEHVVAACAAHRVRHLVFLSIAGVHDHAFDAFPYFVAKRAQERVVAEGGVPSTIISSAQWLEFATNRSVATFEDDRVVVQDWLVQPIPVATVVDVLIETTTAAPGRHRTVAGPAARRLPDVAAKMLAEHGDPRPVVGAPAPLTALADGTLLAPPEAEILGGR